MKINDVREKLLRHSSKSYSKRSLKKINSIVIHHSATEKGDAFSIASYHVNTRNWPGIGYHYVILKDGTIQWVNSLETVSYHAKKFNSTAIGICLVGNFTKENLEEKQKNALKELCLKFLEENNLKVTDIKGHKELEDSKTLCPGFDMNSLRKFIGEREIEVYFKEKKLDLEVVIIDKKVHVHIRKIAEQLGFKVLWDGKNKRIIINE